MAAEAPANPAFPWRGFYGGAVTQIVVTYDDNSSTNMGEKNIAAFKDAQDALAHALRHAIEIIERFVPQDALGYDGDKVDGESEPWPVRDEYLHGFRSALLLASEGGKNG